MIEQIRVASTVPLTFPAPLSMSIGIVLPIKNIDNKHEYMRKRAKYLKLLYPTQLLIHAIDRNGEYEAALD